MSGGLPAQALPVLLPDALNALYRAHASGSVALPSGGLRIYHAPSHRLLLRGLLQGYSPAGASSSSSSSPGLPASSRGRSTAVRHLFVTREDLERVFAAVPRASGSSSSSSSSSSRARPARAALAPAVVAALEARRPLGPLVGSRAPAYAQDTLACLAHSAVPPSVSHFHAQQVKA